MMDEERPIPDRLEGIAHPGEMHPLCGHTDLVGELVSQFNSGHLHHALLLTGAKGIGKATLAARLAAQILRNPEPGTMHGVDVVADEVQAKITAGAHPNLLHLARPWDQKAKRFKTQLTVDEVRQLNQFFGTARAEEGWRVAIIDSVTEMNANAANALLKILEEPPERTLFFVICHSGGRILPTIRSRCLHMPMKPLEDETLISALAGLEGVGLGNQVSTEDQQQISKLAGGSVRKAITLLQEGGLELHTDFHKICRQLKALPWGAVHRLADKICARGADERYSLFLDFANQYLESRATGGEEENAPISALARWAEVWEKAQHTVRTANSYNLDKKQVILDLFSEMSVAERA